MSTMANTEQTTMQAMTYRRYGPPEVLELRHVPVPAPGAGEVLVRVHAAGIDVGVVFTLTGSPLPIRAVTGLRRPRRPVLGRALAGRIAAVGPGVTRLRVGDEVYGEITGGAYAEYTVAPEDLLAAKPAGLTFDQAAAVPVSGTTALQGMRDAGAVRPGQRVLINGASGGVGTFAVQIAKALGGEVTAVCSARNADLVRSLGADHVVDYAREDFTRAGERYDVLLDLVGNHPISASRRALAPAGTLVLSAGPPAPSIRRTIAAYAMSPFVGHTLAPLVARPRRQDLDALSEMVEAGQVAPVIDRTYPLDEVPEALRRQAAGHARGKTVITI